MQQQFRKSKALFLEFPNTARLWSGLKNIINSEIESISLSEESIMLVTEENNTIAVEISSTILTVKWVIWKEGCAIRYQDNANIAYTLYKPLLKNELQQLKHMRQQNTAIHNKIINVLYEGHFKSNATCFVYPKIFV